MSTSDKPILFFQDFFEKNKFKKFVNDFFTDYNNPTFYANLEEGYIEFVKDFYNEGDDSTKPIRIYFKDYLFQQLLPQKLISINLIKDKIEAILNNGNSTNNYTNNVSDSITRLKTSIIVSQNQYKDLILPILEKIENTSINPKPQKITKDIQPLPFSKFFEPTINKIKLKKIFALARVLEILDAETTTEEDFTNVFLSSHPESETNKIIFKASNREGLFFVLYMKKYFSNLRPSTIARSRSFYPKPKKNMVLKPLSEASINNVDSFIKKNGLNNKFIKIQEVFKNLENQWN